MNHLSTLVTSECRLVPSLIVPCRLKFVSERSSNRIKKKNGPLRSVTTFFVFAMDLGTGGMVCNIVFCNGFLIAELLEFPIFTDNDGVKGTLVIWMAKNAYIFHNS